MKRHLLIVAIFLLAGAVVNFAGAAYCALYVVGVELHDVWPNVWCPEPASQADMRWVNARGWKPQRGDDSAVTVGQLTAPGITRREYFEVSRAFFEKKQGGGGTGGFISFAAHTRTGLPLKSFEAEEWLIQELWTVRGDIVYECSGGVRVEVEVDIGGPIDLPRPLPLRPVLIGFVANTVFYAAVLWLLIPGPFVLRRFIRIRRGLCPACAYPRGESDVCSECGKAIPSRKVTAI